MYRVEFQCPERAAQFGVIPDTWFQDEKNPYWFLGNAITACNGKIMTCHAARVIDRAGQVLYQV